MNGYIDMIATIKNAKAVSFVFIKKTTNDPSFEIKKLQLRKELWGSIANMYIPVLEKQMKDKSEMKLDPMIDNDGYLNYLDNAEITGLSDITNPLDDIQSIPSTGFEDAVTNSSAFAFIFHNADKKVMILRKLSSGYTLKNKHVLFSDGDRINKLEKELFVLDNKIDCVIYNDKTYILGKYNFEILFNFDSEYTKIAEKCLEKLTQNNSISNIDSFKEHCLNRSRITKKLYKIEKDGYIDKFNICIKKQDIVKKMEAAIVTLQLNFKLENNQIQYDDITTLSEIVNFISNDYLRSFYTDEAFVASSKTEHTT